MGVVNEVKDAINAVDFDKIKIGINLATGLIAAGQQILELLKQKGTLSNTEYLAIIEKADQSKNEARDQLIGHIADAKTAP